MRRLVIWCTLICFVMTQTAAVAGPHEEGTAAGQAANPVIRGTVNAPSASTTVPGYTTTPPETTYYGQPNLSGAANARLTACASTPNDPVCQAQRGALSSANTPRLAISPYDPSVVGARDIALLQRRDGGHQGRPHRLDAGDLEALCGRFCGFDGAGLSGGAEHRQYGK